ncbi:MAG: ATP-dependent RNA helicase DbpA [Hahellaceae bacterium]|nr:ATP-dependent RNA helicase DbpA [Hahellaceae bacterium]MCP5170175.1 ATP-dependent RNA helicase DbpA [Hahellaceae bacterium]
MTVPTPNSANTSTTNAFATLPLSEAQLANLKTLEYHAMTPIQAQSLPHLLAGKDVTAKAKTGSGKTVAFGLGVLHKLNVKKFAVQALVLCPTRELADQVSKELRKLARAVHNIKILTLCGGMPFGPQLASLEHGAHIVVGTPGRIEEHVRKEKLLLDNVTTLVLDEADRMLDMGFRESIDAVVSKLPKQRQTLLFSATYPDTIAQLSKTYQNQPVEVTVESTHQQDTITQTFFEVSKDQREAALLKLYDHYNPASSVVFCNTKQLCQDIAQALQSHGYSAKALHGDLEQKERDQVLTTFANQSCSVLVATDVAARGLDIKDLEAVINYELSRDPEVHVHRIGRTGRSGKKGLALSLFTPSEAYKINLIEDYQGSPAPLGDLGKLRTTAMGGHEPPMITLQIDGGRRDKLRPGDILGALTGDAGIAGTDVGKIDVFNTCAYVAIKRDSARVALSRLLDGKLKGRKFKVRKIR